MPRQRLIDPSLLTGLAAIAALVVFVIVLLAVEHQAAIGAVISLACGALYLASPTQISTRPSTRPSASTNRRC